MDSTFRTVGLRESWSKPEYSSLGSSESGKIDWIAAREIKTAVLTTALLCITADSTAS
jgi:hypothetical protein